MVVLGFVSLPEKKKKGLNGSVCVSADLDFGCWFGSDELIAVSFIEIVQHIVSVGGESCPRDAERWLLFALKQFHITGAVIIRPPAHLMLTSVILAIWLTASLMRKH